MGGISEREYEEKLNKLREKLNKKARDIRKKFEKIEKMKVDSLQDTEKMRSSFDHDVDKMERDITKSKDLAPESKERLNSEIALFKNEIEEGYYKLRTRISETMIPVAEQINY